MKENWKDYVSFSRKERRGIIVLLILILLMSVLPYLIPAPDVQLNEDEIREWQSKLAAWKSEKNNKSPAQSGAKATGKFSGKLFDDDSAEIAAGSGFTNRSPDRTSITHFPFDPNHLPAHEWLRLGIPEKVIRTIVNYLKKGGQFRKPEDIGRIYGMRSADVQRLLPWVRIAGHPKPSFNNGAFNRMHPYANANKYGAWPKDSFAEGNLTVPPVRKKKYTYIDINTADTSAWMTFPGIGSRLALRIVQYREKLGGFYSPDQVAETWALPDTVFQKIKPWLKYESGVFRKIRINTAEIEELKQHPYLRWQLSNSIVQYRKQHGAFNSAEDLHKIITLTTLQITKIAPYLEY